MAIHLVDQAIGLAATLHTEQRDKLGEPYIYHPLRVMEAVRAAGGTKEQVAAAVLHDVHEDIKIPIKVLEAMFGEQVATLVNAVSRRGHETYDDFIDRVICTPDAVMIKICDIDDNLGRMWHKDLDPEWVERKIAQYTKALDKLKKAYT